jgi:hypothetical protein
MEGVRAPARRRNGLVLGLAIVGVVLIALVASGDRVPIASGDGSGVHLAVRPPPPTPEEAAQPPAPHVNEPVEVPGAGVFAVVVQAALILACVSILVAGGWAVMELWPRSEEIEEVEPDLVPRARPDELVDAVDEGLEALATGPVDDVVIACWVRLEGAAAAAGVERLVSETPAELASRVLAELHAPQPAVERLLVRYRTARFSDHRLDDDDRAVAIRSLEEIRAAIVGARA